MGTGFGTRQLCSTVSVINRLGSSLLKPELCWTGGCAVTMKVGEAGMLAACLSLCLNPEVL